MTKYLYILLLFVCLSATAQQTPVTKANYQLAAKFSPSKLNKMVFSTAVDPHWLKKSDAFGICTRPPKVKNGTS